MIKPELLAPAGGMDTLKAAVQAGADAVYLGAGRFNARANAKNFHGDALAEAVVYAKAYNVAVHLAVNTLMTDRELNDALELVSHALELGVAAFIVQDLGLAASIRRQFPSAVLHASTQTTAKTLADVQALGRLGFSRVVMARELSREDLRAITASLTANAREIITANTADLQQNYTVDAAEAHKNSPLIELEVFVHGALCSSYSGQCLMSSFIGGRSANRGRCAQPCRLPYTMESAKNHIPRRTNPRFITTGTNRPAIGNTHATPLLSLKDLCLIDHIGELAKIGITSLKIEGRMKGADYVTAAVTAYRRVLDGEKLTDQEKKKLQAVFDRGGYTDGYFTGNKANMYMERLTTPYSKQKPSSRA